MSGNVSAERLFYGQVATVRETAVTSVFSLWQALRMPGWVWFSMLLLASALLALTVVARERGHLRNVRMSYEQTAQRLATSKLENEQLKHRLQSLEKNPRAYERVAQERLHYVRANEIVVPTR
ncbi:MAG: FtsB family cell division protein [Blastocatellia bacterium]